MTTSAFTGINPLETIVDLYLVTPEKASVTDTDKAVIALHRKGVGTKGQTMWVLGESEILEQLDPEDDAVEVIDDKHGIALITGKRRAKQAKEWWDESYGNCVEQLHVLLKDSRGDEFCKRVAELRCKERCSLRELARRLKPEFGLAWIEPDDSQIAGLAICRVVADKDGIIYDRNRAWNTIL